MYELFILSELQEKPRNGYNLKTILQKIVGIERKISFGVIYPQLDRLESRGYITTSLDTSDSKRTTKLNTITASGQARFFMLMAQPVVANQNAQMAYEIKIGSFHLITPALQLTIMHDYIDYLNAKIQNNRDSITTIQNDKPEMSVSDRADTIDTVELRLVQNQAALKWAQTKLEKIEVLVNDRN